MDDLELIKTRKSVRTFDGRPLDPDDLAALTDFAARIENPYGIPVEFVILDPAKHRLSSPVLVGEPLYVAGTVRIQPHCEEAFGFAFEELVLFAWSRGIGTTWIGGTFDRAAFEAAAGAGGDVIMPIASPLGYPADKPSLRDRMLRSRVKGDERRPAGELFFEGDFETPATEVGDALEAVRWAPSAVNLQPWRVVRVGSDFHFYEAHTTGYTAQARWDVQKIDVGIALCHFMRIAGGALVVEDPGIAAPEGVEYVATVRVG